MAQVHAAASGDATVARAPVDDVTTMQPPGDEAVATGRAHMARPAPRLAGPPMPAYAVLRISMQ